jgi:hypothetical protein
MTLLETANYYHGIGFSVIPLKPRDKTPLINWTEFQKRRSTQEERTSWFASGLNNIGIVTGAISGVDVVDFDTMESMKNHLDFIRSTPVSKTGKGCHALVQHQEGIRNFQKRDDMPGIDLRADGGYIVAPPSIHPNGKQYSWLPNRSLEDIPLAPFPDWILPSQTSQKPANGLINGTTEGGRNDALVRVAGSVFSKGMPLEEANQFCLTWNLQNTPPLTEKEVLATVKSIHSLHLRNNPPSANSPDETPRSQPKLSDEALPAFVGEFIRHACERSEADPAAVLATYLIRYGIECGSWPHVMVGEAKQYARTNAVIVGESSKARKGTSATPVKRLFSGLHGGCMVSKGPLSTGEGLIWAVRDEILEWVIDKKTGAGNWIKKDPGIEDKRLYVQDEELASALQATKREGNTLSPIVRCLWDDGDAEPLTKSNKTKTTGAHVGVITHITHEELKKCLSVTEQLNGFGNRFLWVFSRRQKVLSRPEELDQGWLADYQQRLEKVLQTARQRGRMQFSKDAWKLWDAEYPRLSMAYGGAAGCMVNRGEAQVTRLALIYALIAGHATIEVDDLKAALAFWEYCNASAFYLFGGLSNDRQRTKILDALRDCEEITKTELRLKVFSNHISGDDLDAVLAEMVDQSLVSIHEDKNTGGAPRTVIKKYS